MTKKNRKVKNAEPAEAASAELKAELMASTSAESEAPASDESDVSAGSANEVSLDDALDDVRRSLIEEDAEEGKKSSWWKIGKSKQSGQHDAALPETSSYVIEKPKDEEPYLEQIDELIDLLEPEVEAPRAVALAVPEAVSVEPEAVVDAEELKRRVFDQSGAGAVQELTEMRAIVLEGGEEVFVEVEAKAQDSSVERRQAFENSMRPYRRYINFGFTFLGVVMIVLVLGMLYSVYQRSLPPPVVEVSSLPFPTSILLPGDFNFPLGKGALTDGVWNPRGPEWLAGTEVCRWVAIPWNRQLEAVVRTLTPQDTLELAMSNNDRLLFTVYSIQELTLAKMQALDSNSPCLLLMLAKQNSDKWWVVTALP